MSLRNFTLCALPALALTLGGCEMDVEDEGKMPSVDVKAEAGKLPEYEVVKKQEGKLPSIDVDVEKGRLPKIDVRGPDVDVGTKTVEVQVPTVDVKIPEDQPPASKD